MMKPEKKGLDLPIGFGMALAQNEKAMERFSMLDDTQKKMVVERTHQVSSKQEMKQLVEQMAEGKIQF